MMKPSLLVAALNLVPVLMAVFLPQVFFSSLIFWLLFGRVLLACLSDAILLRIFQKHTENTAE